MADSISMPAQDALKRESRRTRVLMTATLFSPEGAASVRIRDLSTTGANIVATGPLPAPCDIIFKRGPIFVAGHIVWSDGNAAGLRFYRGLSADELGSANG